MKPSTMDIAAYAVGVVYHESVAMAQLVPEADERRSLDWVRAQVQSCPHWPTFRNAVITGYQPPAEWLLDPHRTVVIGWASVAQNAAAR